MSKIARVFHLNKEIQKIYKNGVLQKLFFDWKKYIGEKLNIEKAKGHPSNRISINGKVYQNLFVAKLNQGHAISTLTQQQNYRVNSEGFKLSAKKFTILVPSEFEVSLYTNYISDITTGEFSGWKNKIVWTNSSETNNMRIMLRKPDDSKITVDEVAGKIVLVEGDLTQETITEDSIKYLKEGCSELRNLTIQGKTYQNLVDINSYQNVTGINLVDNKVEYQTTETQSVGVINPISIKSDTKYTLITDILDTNGCEKSFIIRVTDENNNYNLNLGSINADTVEKKFLVFTTPSDLTYFKILLYNSSSYAGIKFTFPILLEGDYTNIDLPNSIDGIESVAERETINLLKDVEWHEGWINIDTGKIEDKNSSYPNARYSDLINVDPNVLYVANLPQSANSSRLRTYKENGISYMNSNINTFKELYNASDSQKKLISKVRILILDVTKTPLPDIPFLVEEGEDPDKTNFINIRTYNYNCESDGIVLPNGVKNTIEEVNGVMNYVQRVGKIIIDGTQKMTLSNVNQTQTSRIFFTIDNAKYSNGNNNLLCNWYIRNGVHGDFEYIIIQYSEEKKSTALVISVLNNKLETSDLNGIKKYFKENPLTVYYQLKSPIFSPLYDSKEMKDTPMLPNGIQDELILTDSGFKKVQKINTIILNGTENWSLRVSNDDFTVFNCSGLSMLKTSTDYLKSASKMTCKEFAPSNISTMDSTAITKEGICLRESGTGFILSISKNKLDTQNLAGFKSYLQSNPVTVTYELDSQILVDTHSNYPFENDTFDITLPLGQKDTIDGGYITKRIWKLTIDNTTSFNLPTSLVKDSTILISISITSITKEYDSTISALCDTLEFKNIYDLDETGFFINKAGNTLYIRLAISDYGSTLAEVKEKLKTNKIIIYYPLVNEIKIPYVNKINISQPLRSLPNGTCDTIEGNKLVQRVGKVILDGVNNKVYTHTFTNDIYLCVTYTDSTFSSSSDVFNLIVDGSISVASKNIMYNITEKDTSFEGINKRVPSYHGIFIRVPISFASTADEFNTYLQQNPMTVYYPLAEPVETELDLLPTISVKEGTNLITTTNNIKPNIQAECLVRCNETNMLNVKEFVGEGNTIIDKIKVEKGKNYSFTFTNNLGENDANNSPNIIATDMNVSISSYTHNTLYAATINANLGVVYTYKSNYNFTPDYDYLYITSSNANTTSKNLSDMCLKRV